MVLYEEYPLIRGLHVGYGVLKQCGIFAVPGWLHHEGPKVLHQFIVKACAIQDLEGLVPLSEGLALESEFVLVVVLCEGLECLLVVEEVLENPQLA